MSPGNAEKTSAKKHQPNGNPKANTNSLPALPPASLFWAIALATLIFFASSNLRHGLFHSTGFDLGIYDQVVYLISQGQSPISSFLGYHHLGNHAAWAVYPLGLLYKISADVRWLFFVQAFCLAIAAGPTWSLARLAGLKSPQAIAIAIVYLLYPVVFNVNLFDFHPEVMALPAMFAAILAAQLQQVWWFCAAIAWILGCKAALSLTVAGMGFWLLVFEKRKRCGLIALCLGGFWFIIVTQGIIPFFSSQEVAGVGRYSYLADSVTGIIINMLLLPQLVLAKIFSWETIKYLLLLMLPVFWGLFPGKMPKLRNLTPLVAAMPTLFLNILSDVGFQRSLDYQYSLPVIPFLLLAVIYQMRQEESSEDISPEASGLEKIRQFLQKHDAFPPIRYLLAIAHYSFPKKMMLWSLLTLLLLGNLSGFSSYWQTVDTWQANREAIATIKTTGGVLTDNKLAPHLTHRPIVKLLNQTTPDNLGEFDYVVLNLRHPWPDTEEAGVILSEKLKTDSQWQLTYQQDEVLVFERILSKQSPPNRETQ